jgi:hypothetical protein
MADNDFLRSIQQQVENEYLAKEKIYNQIRETGEEAPAKILSMMDRGESAWVISRPCCDSTWKPSRRIILPSAPRHRTLYPIYRVTKVLYCGHRLLCVQLTINLIIG